MKAKIIKYKQSDNNPWLFEKFNLYYHTVEVDGEYQGKMTKIITKTPDLKYKVGDEIEFDPVEKQDKKGDAWWQLKIKRPSSFLTKEDVAGMVAEGVMSVGVMLGKVDPKEQQQQVEKYKKRLLS
jgi:hypothetical protein